MNTDKNELGELKKVNLYQQAIDSLLNYIIANGLKTGDKLPTENTLKDIFRISRNTLREALKSLQLIGIIETKQNSGIVIKDFSISDIARFVPYSFQIKNNENLQKLCEAREWLEISILPMLMERMNEEDIIKLNDIILEIDDNIHSKKKLHELDYQFHLFLLESCRNPFISNMAYILEMFFSIFDKHYINPDSSFKQSHKNTNYEHKAILECIRSKDLNKLQNIYKKHLSTFSFDCIKQVQ